MNESLVVHSAILYLHEQQKKIHNNNEKNQVISGSELKSSPNQKKAFKNGICLEVVGNDVPLNVKTSFSLPLVKHR
jgi:hypothetical protein